MEKRHQHKRVPSVLARERRPSGAAAAAARCALLLSDGVPQVRGKLQMPHGTFRSSSAATDASSATPCHRSGLQLGTQRNAFLTPTPTYPGDVDVYQLQG